MRKLKDDYIIRKTLIGLGISSNVKAFNYIIQATKIIEKQQIHTNITTIYEMISNNSENTKTQIERCIRNSINYAYKKNKIMKEIYFCKPSNASFIYDLVFNIDIFNKKIENNIIE